eukprot:gene715-796_t
MRAARNGQVKILVASDQLARGIDLPAVRLVVNYDPPNNSRTYIHRAGRTARAGQSGHCLTLLKVGQLGGFRKVRAQLMSALSGREIPKCRLYKRGDGDKDSITNFYREALAKLPALLR